MGKLLVTSGKYDFLNLSVSDAFIIVFDTSIKNGDILIEAEMQKPQMRNCTLFIAVGSESEVFEQIVDDYLINLDGKIFFPTISEQDVSELGPIINGWRQAENKNVILYTENINMERKLETILGIVA